MSWLYIYTYNSYWLTPFFCQQKTYPQTDSIQPAVFKILMDNDNTCIYSLILSLFRPRHVGGRSTRSECRVVPLHLRNNIQADIILTARNIIFLKKTQWLFSLSFNCQYSIFLAAFCVIPKMIKSSQNKKSCAGYSPQSWK